MKIKLANVIFWCSSFHETKAKKQDNKEQPKNKEGKNKDKTTRKGKNKKEKRERERVTERNERSQGERKGDTEKWTKITLFQGKNSVFVKRPEKTKKNKKVEGELPQNSRAMRRSPQSQEEGEQKRKHLDRKRGVWKGPPEVCEKGSHQKNRIRRENPPHRSGEAILGPTPNPTKKCVRPRTRRASNLRARPTQRQKNAFENDLGSAAPTRFWTSKHNFVKKSNFWK